MTTNRSMQVYAALLLTIILFYAGTKQFISHHSADGPELWDSTWQALLMFCFVLGVMTVLSIMHIFSRIDLADHEARISARAVMRWQAKSVCLATFGLAQYLAWWLHATQASFFAEGASGCSWICFAIFYGVFVRMDKAKSDKAICSNGSGRGTLVQTGLISSLGFVSIGLAPGEAMVLLYGVGAAVLSAGVFAITTCIYQDGVDREKDFG
jgi:hypothetical protein